MADHRIRVRTVGTSMAVECRDCVERLDDGYRQSWLVSELADLAHQHIEQAEAADLADEHRDANAAAAYEASEGRYGWPERPENPDITPVKIETEAYRQRAAVTDPKELVKMIGPEEETPSTLRVCSVPGCGCIGYGHP